MQLLKTAPFLLQEVQTYPRHSHQANNLRWLKSHTSVQIAIGTVTIRGAVVMYFIHFIHGLFSGSIGRLFVTTGGFISGDPSSGLSGGIECQSKVKVTLSNEDV